MSVLNTLQAVSLKNISQMGTLPPPNRLQMDYYLPKQTADGLLPPPNRLQMGTLKTEEKKAVDTE